MLATLYPKYESSFNEPMSERTSKFFSDDPLLSNYKKGEDVRLILARWFSQGEYIRRVTTILNNLMRKDKQQTRFRCQDETAHDNTFYDVIVGSIDDGLPVMLGWNTPDYGDHAVLVTGYWEGQEKWFYINDPGGDYQVSWDSLKLQKTSKFEVGLCKPKSHTGHRPMKSISEKSSTEVYRWTTGGWRNIEKDFS